MPEKMQGWQKSSAGTGSFPKPGWDRRMRQKERITEGSKADDCRKMD
jgi:hypothetical protein